MTWSVPSTTSSVPCRVSSASAPLAQRRPVPRSCPGCWHAVQQVPVASRHPPWRRKIFGRWQGGPEVQRITGIPRGKETSNPPAQPFFWKLQSAAFLAAWNSTSLHIFSSRYRVFKMVMTGKRDDGTWVNEQGEGP